ncbi:MAG: hypothetical protein IIT82_07950, partial [Selenomonas sp.]|nr:hypothetical protein [Selenomonas sp.]
EEAVRLLQDFADKDLASQLEGSCPDAQMLLAYAEAMNQVALYRGHMTNKDVAADRKLLSIVQDMPEGYKGRLSEKILPFQRLIVAMCKRQSTRQSSIRKMPKSMRPISPRGNMAAFIPATAKRKLLLLWGSPAA